MHMQKLHTDRDRIKDTDVKAKAKDMLIGDKVKDV